MFSHLHASTSSRPDVHNSSPPRQRFSRNSSKERLETVRSGIPGFLEESRKLQSRSRDGEPPKLGIRTGSGLLSAGCQYPSPLLICLSHRSRSICLAVASSCQSEWETLISSFRMIETLSLSLRGMKMNVRHETEFKSQDTKDSIRLLTVGCTAGRGDKENASDDEESADPDGLGDINTTSPHRSFRAAPPEVQVLSLLLFQLIDLVIHALVFHILISQYVKVQS